MKRSIYLIPAYLLLAACEAPASDNIAAETGESSSSAVIRSEEHTSELQSRSDLVCRLLLVKKKA